jgi:tetratricopeptide (TPR) repeat protein/nitrate/TMAO reductase-like tetraheme cytochrome c subunit
MKLTAASMLCTVVVAGLSTTFVSLAGEGDRSDKERQAYAEQVARSYSYRFGKNQPFLPSNAQIVGNTFIQAGAFPTAQYCRGCHAAAYQQWRQSLHANSFRTPFYTKNVGLLQNSKGIEYSRHCEGCHNPIELLSGLVTSRPASANREFDQDGVTCMVCHSIAKLQPTYGVGSYVMGIPAVMLDEQGRPIAGEVGYDQIFDHIDRHKAAVMKDFYRTPEYCASCHQANIPRSLNDYKWLRAIGLYGEWQRSSYAKESPLPFFKKDYQSCQSCHMPREEAQQEDPATKKGTIASHRWIAGNTAIPFLYGYNEQLKKTLDYLKADKLNVDLFALARTDGSGLIAPLGTRSFTIKQGEELQAIVVIQNKGIGHALIPEQRDMYQAWVEFEVTDAAGKVLQASGRLNSDGNLDPSAHCFVTRLLDADGRLLTKHEIWKRRFTATDATIPPGRSTLVRYVFHIPKNGAGPYTITARVNYRHFNELFTNFALGDKHPAYPVVEMAARSRELKIGDNTPIEAGPKDNPDWMRWNNFGIASLDQGQYTQAERAFVHVSKLRSDYSDAYTNLGIVYLQLENFAAAGKSLTKALTSMPNDARSLYYQALVERNEGKLDDAAADLKKVAALFPRSADAHRELGFSYYQQHKYALARTEYETVRVIDPDDLSAHFNLAIIYRRLGEEGKAEVEAALYRDKKDDPMVSTPTLTFLRSRTELSHEGAPWHLHLANQIVGK